jgi:exodeoxyribonuclease VII large subunit
VSQLGAEIQEFLGTAFAGLWVAGEVQRPVAARSGHLYFELVEKGSGDQVIGRLDAVLFRSDYRRVRAALGRAGVELVEGETLRCFGGLDLYPPSGRLQLVVREVDPLFTVGALAQRRRDTLRQLEVAGLLELNRRLDLPRVPLRVALIASAGSAGAADFLATLESSPWAFSVELLDVAVQGARAEGELVAALGRVERRVAAGQAFDLIALVRGGGARTDLAVFDSRRVAEAVARASRPVLTGLGHEIDQSVTDRVAHRAFKTPTGVAEFLCQRVAEAERALLGLAARVGLAAGASVRRGASRVERAADRVRLAGVRLERLDRRLAELGRKVALAARERVRADRRRVAGSTQRLAVPVRRRLAVSRGRQTVIAQALSRAAAGRLRAAAASVAALDRLCAELSPQRVLARGYSITRDSAGRTLRDAGRAAVGAVIVTRLERGELSSRVEATRHGEEGTTP